MLKTRFQINPGGHLRLIPTIKEIIAEGGIKQLYRGEARSPPRNLLGCPGCGLGWQDVSDVSRPNVSTQLVDIDDEEESI